MDNRIQRSDGVESVEFDKNGTVRHYNYKGRLHRINGPAVISISGTQSWFSRGKRHRIGGPAYTTPDGSEVWFKRGTIHRLDGPAFITPKYKDWYLSGVRVPINKIVSNFIMYMILDIRGQRP